jgi:hypothetical protein
MQSPDVAFILDIDGVLVRGHNALPCALPALKAIESAGNRSALSRIVKVCNPVFTRLPVCFRDKFNGLHRGSESTCNQRDSRLQHRPLQDDSCALVHARSVGTAAGVL